ncbi:MAG: hypothetical protein HY881_04435 [Deltaproteobacteria bacterium]|nr:hypothetical protein [Deltaproteobacteria bacterium]
MHGRVYVPVTEMPLPNSLLGDIPEHDIRGGISVSIPMECFSYKCLVRGHVLLWFIGIGGLFFWACRLLRNANRKIDRIWCRSLTINREEKMIQLKEEINTLLGQMGKEKKYKIVE